MNPGPRETPLTSFDRQVRLTVEVQRPADREDLERLDARRPRIARGSGVSYTAASFASEVVSQSMAALDRILEFDADTGTLQVEAGATIAAVQRHALARGWYLPVAPGHPLATVGGCIAANVHGKNPARDGCFAAVTGTMQLFHPRLGWQETHPGDALWQATLGGFGLTGTIVEARLRLRRAPARITLRAHPVADLAEAAATLRAHADADLVYGWHDGRPARFGRGLIRVGTASTEAAPSALPRVRLPARYPAAPVRLWNPASLALANNLLIRNWARPRKLPLGEALLPMNAATVYFANFGRRGMLECQWLVPHAAFADFAATLTACVRRLRPVLPLISSKIFAGEAAGIALDGAGIALALHVAANPGGRAFARELAAIALDHGARPNPVKDSSLEAIDLRRAVAGLDAWCEGMAIRNPGGLLQSELARRLGLC